METICEEIPQFGDQLNLYEEKKCRWVPLDFKDLFELVVIESGVRDVFQKSFPFA